MNTKQKIIAVLGGLALAFVLLRPPGYDVYEPGDLGYVQDPQNPFATQYSYSQDWIYEHDEIAGKYLFLEVVVIAGLWWGGNRLFRTEPGTKPGGSQG